MFRFVILLLALTTAVPAADWLIHPESFHASVSRQGQQVVMTNGLLRRTWRIAPDAATVGFDNLVTGESILRAVKPEASVTLDGHRYDVGGLAGQPDLAYLRKEWLDSMTPLEGAFHFAGFETGRASERFAWKRVTWSGKQPWPPPGVSLILRFAHAALPGVTVSVHYEMYDAIPLLAKWLEVKNGSAAPVNVDSFTSEILAAVEGESLVENPGTWKKPNLLVESDYSFVATHARPEETLVAQWVADPGYTTQVNYRLATPALLECRPPIGPGARLAPGAAFESFRIFELALDSTDRERNGLAQRRMYRVIAPWSQENPILMHVRKADPAAVKLAIDQSAATGFEMVILTFGSGFDIEKEDPAYLQQVKELADYARTKGIALGGYSLLASRTIGLQDDVVNDKPIFDHSPCLGSRWGAEYFRKLRHFIEVTGISVLEHDGSYPGDTCASTKHPGHDGLDDSQWKQWSIISDFYKWCRARGVYLNVPDWYFLNGSTKTAMGYREVNWSLPRERQVILARQNIFDGTWNKTPSMGWMFVPLVQYQGGGEAATLEPLRDHLPFYEQHLLQNFGAGVQACYRGPRLYDSEETKAVVAKWVHFYKTHREILDSDIIHLRRPDGRDWDGIMHVNPALQEKGLVMLYNPQNEPIERTITLPVYYSGLTEAAVVREQAGAPKRYRLDRQYRIDVPVKMAANGFTWLTIE
jgi:hypothetical protein